MMVFALGVIVAIYARYLFYNGVSQIQYVGDNSTEIQDGESSSIHDVNGNNISCDSKIIVDGKVIRENLNHKCKIIVNVSGDVQSVKTSLGTVTVDGNVNRVDTTLGNVVVDNGIDGNISTTLGNVTVKGIVTGDISSSMGNIDVNKL